MVPLITSKLDQINSCSYLSSYFYSYSTYCSYSCPPAQAAVSVLGVSPLPWPPTAMLPVLLLLSLRLVTSQLDPSPSQDVTGDRGFGEKTAKKRWRMEVGSGS